MRPIGRRSENSKRGLVMIARILVKRENANDSDARECTWIAGGYRNVSSYCYRRRDPIRCTRQQGHANRRLGSGCCLGSWAICTGKGPSSRNQQPSLLFDVSLRNPPWKYLASGCYQHHET